MQGGQSSGLSLLRASRYLINQTDPEKLWQILHIKTVVIKYSTVFCFVFSHKSAKYCILFALSSKIILLVSEKSTSIFLMTYFLRGSMVWSVRVVSSQLDLGTHPVSIISTCVSFITDYNRWGCKEAQRLSPHW